MNTLTATVLENEPAIRLAFFLGIFVVMAVLEMRLPRRVLTQSKSVRWLNNLGVVVLNSVLLRLVFPAAAVGMAAFAESAGWGLFNYLDWPMALEFFLVVVLLDGVIYLQHVMFHAVPAFWRLHRMHHTDMDFDVTTGARFHPIEILLSMVVKFAVIAALGAPPVAVIVFEVLLSGMAMFNHANVKLPQKLDAVLRWVIVTPDVHRIHHSVIDYETNTNYGFNLSIWDRIFGTFTEQPEHGHEGMTIGIVKFRDKKFQTLPWMLIQPFIGKVEEYVINRRQWRP